MFSGMNSFKRFQNASERNSQRLSWPVVRTRLTLLRVAKEPFSRMRPPNIVFLSSRDVCVVQNR